MPNNKESASQRLEKATYEIMKRDGLAFSQAFAKAQAENPDEAQEYLNDVYLCRDQKVSKFLSKTVGELLNAKVNEHIKNNPSLSYSEALRQVCSMPENQIIAETYVFGL